MNYGGNATFAIAPNPYYKIVDVTVDGVSQGTIASYTFTNVTADHVITATFTKMRTFLPAHLPVTFWRRSSLRH